jgi:8-oxo-dGTP diphosphatase
LLLTTLCYIENNNRYLMLHRVKKREDVNIGKWIGIGGKMEAGESPEECVFREVQEETGLRLVSYRLRGLITFISTGWEPEIIFLFTATEFSGTLTDCHEGELQWVDIHAVLQLNIWEGDKYFLEMLEKNQPFFSMKLIYERERLKKYFLDGREII